MKISRLSATGNTFVVVETDELSEEKKRDFVLKNVAELDGVIFVEDSARVPRMVYFNRDGSRARFCGNGARAFLWFLYRTRGIRKTTFRTDVGLLNGEILRDGTVLVEIPQPILRNEIEVRGMKAHLVEVGVPHLVVEMEGMDRLDLVEFARPLRFEYDANVNVYRVEDERTLRVRTYERGVEDETKACGSGAVAVAFVCRNFLSPHITELNVITRGGKLKVVFRGEKVFLGGGVEEWKKV